MHQSPILPQKICLGKIVICPDFWSVVQDSALWNALGAKVSTGISYINLTALMPEAHAASICMLPRLSERGREWALLEVSSSTQQSFLLHNSFFLQISSFFSAWWKCLLVTHNPFKHADHVMNLICILVDLSQGINCFPNRISQLHFCSIIQTLWLGSHGQFSDSNLVSEFQISQHLISHVLKCFSIIIGSIS